MQRTRRELRKLKKKKSRIVGLILRERGAYVTDLTKQDRFYMTNSY